MVKQPQSKCSSKRKANAFAKAMRQDCERITGNHATSRETVDIAIYNFEGDRMSPKHHMQGMFERVQPRWPKERATEMMTRCRLNHDQFRATSTLTTRAVTLSRGCSHVSCESAAHATDRDQPPSRRVAPECSSVQSLLCALSAPFG